MALVKLGFGIQDIRGKVGGSVFAGTRSGLVLKNKTRKKETTGYLSALLKSYMSANSYSWSNLSDSQRTAWNTYASVVNIHQKRNGNLFISGRELFLKYNQYRLLYNLSPLLNIVFDYSPVQPVSFDVNINLGALVLEASRIMIPADEFVIMSITQPVRRTLNNPGSRFRFLIFPTTAIQIFDISSAYISVFGILPVSGQTIFYRATNLPLDKPTGAFMDTVKKSLI